MQSEEGGSLVRRDGSGNKEKIPCVLLPRCMERHFPVNCALFRKLPVQHRVSLLLGASVCKKCLSHSRTAAGRNNVRSRAKTTIGSVGPFQIRKDKEWRGGCYLW